MGKQMLDDAIRNDIIARLTKILSEELNADVMPISASEFVTPAVDAEGNEKFVRVSVSVPRGSRNKEGGYIPYDGYKLAEDWRLECEAKALDKAHRAEEKARIEAEKERKREEKRKAREAKATLAKLKKADSNFKSEEDDPNQYLDKEVTF